MEAAIAQAGKILLTPCDSLDQPMARIEYAG
jgi:hypothetical protein